MRSSALTLRLAGAAFLLLASAAPAAASDTNRAPAGNASAESGGSSAEAAAPAKKAAKPRAERKICRYDDAIGSNLRTKKICLTARQWRERQ